LITNPKDNGCLFREDFNRTEKRFRLNAKGVSRVSSQQMDRIRRDIISFDVQERCSPTWPEPMAAEDDEALGYLAG
jgi:hypothetical protein